MDENKFKSYQLILQIVDIVLKTLGIIFGFIIGASQFSKGLRENEINEYARQLRQKRLETYITTSETVGEILSSSSSDKAQFIAASHDFIKLYWGKMNFIEDSLVTSKMVRFRLQLTVFDFDNKDSIDLKDLSLVGGSLIATLKNSARNELEKLKE